MKSYKASPGLGFTRPNSMLVCIIALVFLSSLFVPTRAHAFGCSTAQGTVRDTLGRPIAGATVALVGEACESREYQTGTDGSFVTRISGVISTKSVLVTKPGFVDLSTEVYSDSHPLKDNDFTLKFAHVIDATPYAQRSGNVEVITARTVAPPSVDVRVDVKRDSDLIATELAYSHSDEGWNYFRGQFSHPVGDPTRYYTLASCAVGSSFSGSCQEAALVSGALLSEVGQTSYWIDDIPPELTSVIPEPERNLINNRRPFIQVNASDLQSGVSDGKLWLDGALVDSSIHTSPAEGWYVPQVCGCGPIARLEFWPPGDLGLGVHEVRYELTDSAGNITSGSWQFGIVSFISSAPNGSLRSQEVDVNPSGVIVGAPTSVTFRDVVVDVSEFTGSFSAAPFPGYDRLRFGLSLSTANVRFYNETPVASDPVAAGLAPVFVEKFGGILLPSNQPSAVRFSSSSIVIPSVTVNVPAGYNTQGSKAVLSMVNRLASTPYFQTQTLALIPPVTLPVVASLSQTTEVSENSPQSVSENYGSSPKVWVYSTIGGQTVSWGNTDLGLVGTLNPPPNYNGEERTFADEPTRECSHPEACTLTTTPVAAPSQNYLTNSAGAFEIGNGVFQFFATHWLYLETSDGLNNYIDWAQTSALMYPDAGCLKSYTATSIPQSSGWTLNNLETTEESTNSGGASPTFDAQLKWPNNEQGSSLVNSGYAHPTSIFDSVDGAYRTGWSVPSTTALPWSPQQMVSAFEFKNESIPRVLSLNQEHTVTFVLGGCQ